MPRLSHMIVDGLAFILVGVGLIAVAVGYERNLPKPAAAVVAFASDWIDPVSTGAITPRSRGTAEAGAATRPEPDAGRVSQSAAPAGRAWIDPPRR